MERVVEGALFERGRREGRSGPWNVQEDVELEIGRLIANKTTGVAREVGQRGVEQWRERGRMVRLTLHANSEPVVGSAGMFLGRVLAGHRCEQIRRAFVLRRRDRACAEGRRRVRRRRRRATHAARAWRRARA